MQTACLSLPVQRDETASKCVILARGMGARNVLRLRRMLEGLCFSVTVVETLEAALTACRGGDVPVLAPANDAGFRLMWLLRQRGVGAPRIAVLPEASVEKTLLALAAGAHECLAWPFETTLLAQRLRLARAAMADESPRPRLAAS